MRLYTYFILFVIASITGCYVMAKDEKDYYYNDDYGYYYDDDYAKAASILSLPFRLAASYDDDYDYYHRPRYRHHYRKYKRPYHYKRRKHRYHRPYRRHHKGGRFWLS